MEYSYFKNILATIIYYDILDYPLTSFEIWKYLLSHKTKRVAQNDKEASVSLKDVLSELENEEIKKYIEKYQGFYFLKGRQGLVAERLDRNKISSAKIKKILRVAKILKLVPFIRSIAVTGRVAMKNAQAKSDLDLLIILEKERIFIGRILVTLLVHFIGQRRYGKKITNRICLNYFITTESLEIELQDLFSSSEYSFIFPLFNFEVFKKFQGSNQWIGNWRANYHIDSLPGTKIIKDNNFSRMTRKIIELVFNREWLEKIMKEWQTKKIANNPLTWQPGSAVRANEKMLVFLPEPQGPRIYERFQKRLAKLGNL